MKLLLKKNETTVIIHVFIQDSSSTVGAGLTGLTFETGSLVAYYVKPGGTLTSLTLETISTLGTYQAPTSSAHMRFKLMHDTNAPGLYEIHLHTDTLATNDYITIMMHGAANMAPLLLEIQLTDIDMNTALSSSTIAAVSGAVGSVTTKTDYELKSITAANLAKLEDILDGTGGTGIKVNSIENTGTTTLTGAVSLGSTLGVTGTTTLAALSVTGQLDAGNVVVDAGMDIVGALSANSLLIDTTTTLTGNVLLGGTLGVTGVATLNSIVITGAATGISVTGTTAGVSISGGTTGIGLDINGGSSSGIAVDIDSTSGHAVDIAAAGAADYGIDVSGGAVGVRFLGSEIGSTGLVVSGDTYDIDADIHGTLSTVTTATGATVTAINDIDFSATMKTSLDTACDTVTATSVTDKTGYSLAADQAVNVTKINGVATNLNELMDAADTDKIVNNSVLAKMTSKSATADWTTFVNTTDSQEALADSLVAGFPTNEHADDEPGGGEVVTGSNIANDGDSTWLNDGTYWQIEPAAADGDGFGLSVIQTFTIGTSLRVSQIAINAKEIMVGVAHVWAYNYTTVEWDQLSDISTAISGAADNDYVFPLLSSHQQTSDGEIKIRYTSTTTAGSKYLYIDQALISANPTGSGPTVGEIGEAVWTNRFGHDVAHHVPKYTGKMYYVDGTNGDDTNVGDYVHGAFKTIAYAISQASAGDRIVVRAGTYDEAALDMNLDGLELRCEHGTTITHSGSETETLLMSGAACVATGFTVTDAGRVGVKATGVNALIEDIISGPGNTIGFECIGNNPKLNRCFCFLPTVAGFKISGSGRKLNNCVTIGNAATIGFWFLTGANGSIKNCNSNGHTTHGWQIDAGANFIIIDNSSTGETDGAVLDNGTSTSWRDFTDSILGDVNVIQVAGTVQTALDINDILDDTSDLQGNQGAWLTATGFATPTNITAGTITTVSGNVNGSVASCAAAAVSAIGAGVITAASTNADFVTEMAAACNTALVAINLDHLMKTAVANNADMTTEVPDGTVLSNMLSATSDTSTFVVADDSLQGISEGAAGGGASAQEVWEYGTRTITAGSGVTAQEVWEYGTRTITTIPADESAKLDSILLYVQEN